MTYTLVGNRYIGTGALPTPVAGYQAQNTTTGDIYESNTSSTAWVLLYNANQANGGLAPVTGYTSTGAITGATGWAPNDAPNFTTSAKLNGVDLATTTNLSDTSTTILNGIAPKISEAVAGITTSITVKSNIARAVGLLTFTTSATQTVPLPTYPDGTTANESDCKWIVFFVGSNTAGTFAQSWPCGRSDSNGDAGLILSADPTTTRTFNAIIKDKGGNLYPTIMGYFIEGIKA